MRSCIKPVWNIWMCKLCYRQLHLKYLCNLASCWLQAPCVWHDSVETCRGMIICKIIVHLFWSLYRIKEIWNWRLLCRLCVIQIQVNTFNILDKVTEISGFRRGVDVAFALLGRNAVYVGVWSSTFLDNLSVPSSRVSTSIKFREFAPWSRSCKVVRKCN
jgi:hypothetical protein